jgi:hypothetical protein
MKVSTHFGTVTLLGKSKKSSPTVFMWVIKLHLYPAQQGRVSRQTSMCSFLVFTIECAALLPALKYRCCFKTVSFEDRFVDR